MQVNMLLKTQFVTSMIYVFESVIVNLGLNFSDFLKLNTYGHTQRKEDYTCISEKLSYVK